MSISKKQALSTVFSAADAYENNLAGKAMLFLSVDKHYCVNCMEAAFDKGNFNHLTGLKTNLSPKHFYNLCLSRRLSESDFWFSPDGTTELKLRVLPKVVACDLSARMIGECNDSQPKLCTEVLVGGTHACLGFVRDCGSGIYVPNTLLNGDIRKLTAGKWDRIILTCRKNRDDVKYSEVVFRADNFDWDRLKTPPVLEHLPILKQQPI